jgi:2-polyprenyl-6-methoxyphenol hydroxylase-like FAD-dependent oxidoreductase
MDAEVIVAGAGPVGLMLAGELAARGVDTAVLEARTELYGGAANGHARRPRHFAGLARRATPAAEPTAPLLAARAVEFGATVHRGCPVEGFTQDEDGVTVRLADTAPVHRVRAAYLIGCDGAYSRVREAAGIAFRGTGPTLDTAGHRYGDVTRQAERYRDRRVFLAGGSAHIHHPGCGWGLDLGLQDAANLAWKLAGHLAGWAPPSLLDTYHAERFVAAKRADGRYDPGAPDAHPLAGRLAPDLPLDAVPGRGPVLLDLSDDPGVRAAAAGWADRVSISRYPCPARPDLAALLVRPDGYVAWAAGRHESPARRRTGLLDALRRWFGEPTRPRTALLSHC